MFDSLIKLKDDLERLLPDSVEWEGVTRERRAEVQYHTETLWAVYQAYRGAAVRSQAIWARRSPPTRADLKEIEELATGVTTVTLPNPDGSPEPRRRRLTPAELMVEFCTTHAAIYEVLNAVARVRAELNPRLEHCHGLLRRTEAPATPHGSATDSDPLVSALLPLTERLEIVRQIGLTDPLRLWVEGTVDLTEIEQLILRCEEWHAELLAVDEIRKDAESRLNLIDTTFAEVDRLHREAVAQRRQAHVKIHGIPAPDQAAPWPDPRDSRLVAVRELARQGDRRRLATELASLEREAGVVLRQAKAELADSARPLRERAELRGRLGAYRAKAAALGRIEDLVLEELYQRARTLLWSAPCDLALAAATVAEYQNAVNAASGDRR